MHPEQNYSAPENPGQFDFIVNPGQPQKQKSFTSSSIALRIGLALGALLVLLIAFAAVSSMLNSGSSNTPALTNVLIQQQELVRLTNAPKKEKQSISASNANSVATIQLAVTSDSQELRSYMKTRGIKFDAKKLIYPSRAATDEQLAASAASGTYDTTFGDVLNTQLTEYQQSLKSAYNKTQGKIGRELLNKQYDGATLLLQQLETGR